MAQQLGWGWGELNADPEQGQKLHPSLDAGSPAEAGEGELAGTQMPSSQQHQAAGTGGLCPVRRHPGSHGTDGPPWVAIRKLRHPGPRGWLTT